MSCEGMPVWVVVIVVLIGSGLAALAWLAVCLFARDLWKDWK